MPSFTYSELIDNDISYCRFRLDDVDPDDYRCSDETITACINMYGLEGALVLLCNSIKLFYGKEPDRIGLSNNRLFSFKDRFLAYSNLYDELLAEWKSSGTGAGGPGIGGGYAGILEFPPEVEIQFLPFSGIPKPSPYTDSPEVVGVPFRGRRS